MNRELKKFINENRDSFDSEEPSPELWQKISADLRPKGRLIFMRKYFTMASAVAVLLVVFAGILFFLRDASDKNSLAQQTKIENGTKAIIEEINPDYAKEVYHFTQLIELKQNQLERIKTTEPGLYNKFLTDITKLDSSYNALQKQLPQNPNREQLLEAMIQNLRLQTDLLNQQLLILQQIKNSKKNSNEDNSKSI